MFAACCQAPARLRVDGSEISRGLGRHVVRARVVRAVADGSDTSTAEELNAAMEDVISSGFALAGAAAPAMDEQQVAEVKRKLEVAGSLLEQALAARVVLEVRRPAPLSPRATPHELRGLARIVVRTRRRVLRPGVGGAPTKHGDAEFRQTQRYSFPAQQLVRREYLHRLHGSRIFGTGGGGVGACHAVRSASQFTLSSFYVVRMSMGWLRAPMFARACQPTFELIRVGGVRAWPISVATSLSLR